MYKDFMRIMDDKVIPLSKTNPSWERLDGELKGGNRKVFCYFEYRNIRWKINSDTRFYNLKLAYDDVLSGYSPFEIEENNTSINLRIELRTKFKHLYIYRAKN